MNWIEPLRAFLRSKNAGLVWSALTVIFVSAAWFRSLCPGIPISDPDTWGYLNPALSDLAGQGFQQTHGRGICYPLFVKWTLQFTGSFFAIPTLQHILGLISGMAWWAIWREWLKWLPIGWRNAFAIQIVGLFFLALYLWNANAIISEEMIRPEGVFPLLSLVQTFLCMIYARLRWKQEAPLGSFLAGVLAILTGVICVSVKPSWGLAGVVPIALALLGSLVPFSLGLLRRRVLPLAFGLALVFAWSIFIPKWTGWITDSSSRTFLPSTLVTIHAPIISKFLNSEARKGNLNDAEVAFLKNWDRRLEESKKLTKTSYRILGYDPDYLMYHSDALKAIPDSKSAEEKRAFLMRIYIKSALSYPHLIFLKVLKQLPVAFGDLTRTLYRSGWGLNKKLDSSIESMDFYKLPEVEAKLKMSYLEVRSKTIDFIRAGAESLKFGPPVNSFLLRGAGPVLLAALMLGWVPVSAYTIYISSIYKNTDFYRALMVFGIFWATCLGTVITVAFVHSFDINRYLYLLSGPLSLLLATGISLLIPWVFETFQIHLSGKRQGLPKKEEL